MEIVLILTETWNINVLSKVIQNSCYKQLPQYLQKTERDRIMKSLSIKFPEYKWEKNKGYPTKKHREAILKFSALTYIIGKVFN